tara:strand:- start:433 stop:762 length:330 start_codon:yes stop_codon:yes gene_type:complete
MPIENKRGLFKNRSARLLAEKFDIPSEAIPHIKYITENDVKWIIDNMYYDDHGVALFNKLNVPKEKRYDTDWNAYTYNEFKNYYPEDFKLHWNKAIIYIPSEVMLELVD